MISVLLVQYCFNYVTPHFKQVSKYVVMCERGRGGVKTPPLRNPPGKFAGYCKKLQKAITKLKNEKNRHKRRYQLSHSNSGGSIPQKINPQ